MAFRSHVKILNKSVPKSVNGKVNVRFLTIAGRSNFRHINENFKFQIFIFPSRHDPGLAFKLFSNNLFIHNALSNRISHHLTCMLYKTSLNQLANALFIEGRNFSPLYHNHRNNSNNPKII